MAGIVGFLDTRLDPESKAELLDSMVKIVYHEPWYHLYRHLDGSVGLATVTLGLFDRCTQPIWNEGETCCIVMEGEIYPYQIPALQKKLRDQGHRLSTDDRAELLLHLYESEGVEFTRGLNGAFNLAIWDKREQKLIIANDRYGLLPIFYAQTNQGLFFGSELKAVLLAPGVSRAINPQAVANFFAFGHLLGEETLFEAIRLLPPATVLVYQPHHLDLTSYWDFQFQPVDYRRREQDWVDALAATFKQAVRRQTQVEGTDSLGFLLSGGMDTRTIVAMVDRSPFPWPTFTFGNPESWDAILAREVAQAIQAEHHFIPIGPDFFPRHAERGVWLTDGLMKCHIFNVMDPLPTVRAHVRLIISGDSGGGILGGYSLRRFMFKLPPDQHRSRLFHHYSHAITPALEPHFYHPSFLPEVRGLSWEGFNQALPDQGDTAARKFEHFTIRHILARTSYYGIGLLRDHLEVRLPFYDNDLFDLAFQIPPHLKMRKQIQIKALRQVSPRLARIRWDMTGLPADKSTLPRVYLQLAKKRLHKYLHLWSKGRIPYRDRASVMPVGTWLRGPLRSWMEGILLRDRSLGRGYFNPTFVRQLVAEHSTGAKDHTLLLSLLLTFEMWNRLFLDDFSVRTTARLRPAGEPS